MTGDLSGDWIGNYTYSGELEPFSFQARLVELDGRIAGETSESGCQWDSADPVHALLEGRRVGAEVDFTKVYDTIEDDPVFYEGSVDDQGMEIHGTWTIIGVWSGSFVMRRTVSTSQAAEIEEAVPV